MNTEIRTGIVVDLSGNIERKTQTYGQSLGNFAQAGQRHMSRLRGSVALMGRGFDALGNRYTALLTSIGSAATIRHLANLDERFERMGVQANKSTTDIASLKQEIYDVARQSNIKVKPEFITNAIDEIVEKTGDLKFARENIENIGIAIQATGDESGRSIGGILAELQKMNITAPKDVLAALDTLNIQGKEGAFTLANLAQLGPRVITAYTATGRGGTQALKEMGAALQVIRMGTGSAEMAATAFEATLRTLTDPEKIKKLKQQVGINVFDPEKLKERKRVLRPINELMTEIVTKAKGDQVKIGEIFDAEAVRAFNQASGEFQRSGAVDSIERFMTLQGDGNATLRDSARLAKLATANWDKMAATWEKAADESLTKLITKLSQLSDVLENNTAENLLKGAVVAGGAAILAGKFLRRKGAGAGSGLGGGGLGGLPLPVPVYVVNKHMSLTPDNWGGKPNLPGKQPTARRSGRGLLSKSSSVLRRASTLAAGAVSTTTGAVLASGAAGYGAGTVIYKAIDETKFADTLGGVLTQIAANFGVKSAQEMLDQRFNFEAMYGAAERMERAAEKMEKANGKLSVEINGQPASVKHVSGDGLDIDVYNGINIGG